MPGIDVIFPCQQFTPHFKNQCCTRTNQPDPLPIDCASIPTSELVQLCGFHYLPPWHACCLQLRQ